MDIDRLLSHSLHILSILVLWGVPGRAQIIPDRTLGGETSVVIPNVTIRDLPATRIDGGAVRGVNLFHSFQEFNVNTGQGVYFSNPGGIENIITRVTGGNVSNINGTLGVLGEANLFFTNPAGIVFGGGARLDLQGSFLGTTANSFMFPNNVEFSATNPTAPPLLVVNIPVGLRFRENAGAIDVRTANRDGTGKLQTSLATNRGKTLALVGGAVNLVGGVVSAPAGFLEIGSVRSGDINIQPNMILRYSDDTIFSDISLRDVAGAYSSDGNIQIQGRNVQLRNGAQVFAGTTSSKDGGSLIIRASELVEIVGELPSFVDASVLPGAEGKGGSLRIETPTLRLSDRASITTDTFGRGEGGTLVIVASQAMEASRSSISASVGVGGQGKGGNITIKTPTLRLTDRAQISSTTLGKGDGGTVFIKSDKLVEGRGPGIVIDTSVQPIATGQGGNLTIEAPTLRLTEGAQISASTFGRGDGGTVFIKASQLLELQGRSLDGKIASDISADVGPEAEGRGGNIFIDTPVLRLVEGAQIGTATFGRGDGGNLFIKASQLVEATGNSLISASVQPGAEGKGGNLVITTDTLRLSGGAQISSGTFGKGDGGTLAIEASQLLEAIGRSSTGKAASGIFANVAVGGEGKGGNLTIETPTLRLTEGAQIASGTFGRGNGGNLSLKVSQLLEAKDSGSLIDVSVQPQAEGKGGNLSIETATLRLTGGAKIQAVTFGKGDGGNLSIKASQSVEAVARGLDDLASGIRADVDAGAEGKGGDLTIETPILRLTEGAQIAAATFGRGKAGTVLIKASQLLEASGSGTAIGVSVQEGAEGSGGNLSIETAILRLTGGAFISATTDGKGDGGSLFVRASQLLEAKGRAPTDNSPTIIRAQARSRAAGKGGNLTIETPLLRLGEGASISVSDFSGAKGAGSLQITTDALSIDNSSITASALRGSEANIVINASDVRLRNNSEIEANAFRNATGGNITINANTLIGFPNTNITANAEKQGGRIAITAKAVLGFRTLSRPEIQRLLGREDLSNFNPFRDFPNSANILAISTTNPDPNLSGQVNISTPEADPSKGLVNLPQNTVDPLQLVNSNVCRVRQGSQFVIKGRGGVPPTVGDNFRSETEVGLADAVAPIVASPSTRGEKNTIDKGETPPALGWVADGKGNVVLVDYDPRGKLVRLGAYQQRCRLP
ncbi:MAG: filamentous hemagglutinin N-terminal domain-containing protein [Pseudanabaenaceae cyanobacterium SKYGB_i_bin29]|nr:filamentous hemagglutinin N-terminal domain-containing protein [Pseudanabaenaceae cyanobacterium SKYG29]MDW8421653.1 filamentous hemagglutinin N-terminal domain-containing protein [Pseudanabaenaceae cyanobacterium SKYGB_i_bin29]